MKTMMRNYETGFNSLILSLLSLAFVTIDWNVSLITFSDICMMTLLLLLVFSKNIFIRKVDLYIILSIFLLLISNVLIHSMNSDVNTNVSIAALIRITFYTIFTVILFNYIRAHKLKEKLLLNLNITTIIVVIIGIYITIVLLLELDLPYEFLWRFTRKDTNSYIFRGANQVVRSRSIFSEPSHYGYYLNTLIGINLFNKEKDKFKHYFIGVFLVALISTFSYSAIGIAVIQLTLSFIITASKDITVLFDKKTVIGLLIIAVVVFVFRELIYTTIINRTYEIYMGYDNSAIERIVYSWSYVSEDTLMWGNGLGNTPNIFNNYAYVLSDIGLVAFIGSVIYTIYLSTKNFGLGILFLLLNFQKGGYISPSFWIMLLLIAIFSFDYQANKIIIGSVIQEERINV